MCIFSAHSVIRDPPFSRLDLISCRNLLIYLRPGRQAQIIPLFHYALRPSGYLFLGSSENVSRHSELFTPLDRKSRIFRRRDLVARPPLPLQQFLPQMRREAAGPEENKRTIAVFCNDRTRCGEPPIPSSSISLRPLLSSTKTAKRSTSHPGPENIFSPPPARPIAILSECVARVCGPICVQLSTVRRKQDSGWCATASMCRSTVASR